MRKIIVTAIAALALAGCGPDEPDLKPIPTVTPDATAAEDSAEAGVAVGLGTDEERLSDGVESLAPVTVTETVTAEPTEEDSGLDADTEHDIALLALDMTWDGMTPSEQDTICNGWNLGPEFEEVLLDSFLEGSGDLGLSRGDVRDFFDGAC